MQRSEKEKNKSFLDFPLPSSPYNWQDISLFESVRICFKSYKILRKLFYHAYFAVSCSSAYVTIVHHLLTKEPSISLVTKRGGKMCSSGSSWGKGN